MPLWQTSRERWELSLLINQTYGKLVSPHRF